MSNSFSKHLATRDSLYRIHDARALRFFQNNEEELIRMMKAGLTFIRLPEDWESLDSQQKRKIVSRAIQKNKEPTKRVRRRQPPAPLQATAGTAPLQATTATAAVAGFPTTTTTTTVVAAGSPSTTTTTTTTSAAVGAAGANHEEAVAQNAFATASAEGSTPLGAAPSIARLVSPVYVNFDAGMYDGLACSEQDVLDKTFKKHGDFEDELEEQAASLAEAIAMAKITQEGEFDLKEVLGYASVLMKDAILKFVSGNVVDGLGVIVSGGNLKDDNNPQYSTIN